MISWLGWLIQLLSMIGLLSRGQFVFVRLLCEFERLEISLVLLHHVEDVLSRADERVHVLEVFDVADVEVVGLEHQVRLSEALVAYCGFGGAHRPMPSLFLGLLVGELPVLGLVEVNSNGYIVLVFAPDADREAVGLVNLVHIHPVLLYEPVFNQDRHNLILVLHLIDESV